MPVGATSGGGLPFPAVERTALGLRLRDTSLHLEPRGRSELGFLAHARGARATLPLRLVATTGTVALLEAAQPRAMRKSAPLPASFGKPFALGPLKLTLFAAGYVRGSAQLLCETASPDRVLYSGDLGGAGPTACATAEPREQPQCDTLVLRATYGHPRYRLPPRAEVLAQLSSFVQRALAARCTPVVLAAPLGGAQEAALHLAGEGHTMRLHPTVLRAAEVYRHLGVPLAEAAPLSGAPAFGEVAILPYDARGSRAAAALPGARTCLLSGRALEPDLVARAGVSSALPLSDHAGFDQLVDFALRSGARRVLTVHGYAEELAQALRDKGLEARALGHEKQLELF
jgi:putative mRNA 3-end processing factor